MVTTANTIRFNRTNNDAFADGDVRVIVLEGQPIQTQKQWYRILDAKTGLIEAGYVNVDDMLSRQPWPEPGDEFPVHVTGQRASR